jgi:hypothetical protein
MIKQILNVKKNVRKIPQKMMQLGTMNEESTEKRCEHAKKLFLGTTMGSTPVELLLIFQPFDKFT